MKQYVIAMTMIVAVCGCFQLSPPEAMEKEIDECVSSISSGKICDISDVRKLSRKISCMSNDIDRSTCSRLFRRKLLSVSIDGLGYGQQMYWVREMLRFCYHEQAGDPSLGLCDAWQIRLQSLLWCRKQLAGLKPVRSVNVREMDMKTYVAYRRWRRCYNGCARQYNETVKWMFKALLPSVLDIVDNDQRQTLIEKTKETFGENALEVNGYHITPSIEVLGEFPVEERMLLGPQKLNIGSDGKLGNTGIREYDYRQEWERIQRK